MNKIPSQDELIAILQSRHPKLQIKPLSDFGKDYKNQCGVWLAGVREDDKKAIKDAHNVKQKFSDWLWSIGWFIECYSYGSFHIIPAADFQEYNTGMYLQ